ncbi:MAG: 3'-5' exonuclease [Actinobacteria bacterium]|nr:3'-5' exonuclease [Actinomycetota bacterium]
MPSPVSAQRFAVVDVETSGLSLRRHHVLQVGVVVIDGDGRVHDRWSSLLAPRSRWFFRVGPTSLHGIHRRDLRAAPPAGEVLAELAARLEGARFVAHNAPFDIGFLQKASQRHHVALPINEPLCTLRMSRALDPDRELRHRLSDLCDRYDVVLVRPHDALADADATAAVLPHLLRAHGITTVDQLASLPSAS